jgi:hypothetical protein
MPLSTVSEVGCKALFFNHRRELRGGSILKQKGESLFSMTELPDLG